ncbi:MAG TPA: sulfotransferase [Casimicrobiaceae bacterium]|nr:sulfotransferase [Casimicrobiaceae bacterium]
MATADYRTTVRNVDVYDDPRFPAELQLLTPKPDSRWAGWSCAVTGSLRLRVQGKRIESIRVCAVSTILDEIAPEYSSRENRYRFGALVSTFGLARRNDIFLNVLLEGGDNFTVCRIDVECDIPPPRPSRYAPILINALPRSGTTWLASILSEHPEIVIYPKYPFEVRQSVYWMSLLRILTNPYHNPKERREMRFLVDRSLVGGSPYYTNFLEGLVPWYATTYGAELAEFMRSMIEKFYRNIDAMYRPGTSEARYFVEKFPGRVPPLTMRWIFPTVRELYLVRNPFDVFRSIFRFNKKRGYPDFGEESLGRSEALFRHVALENQENLAFFEQRGLDGGGVIIKYEDLSTDPYGTLSRLLESFGIDRSDAVIRSMLDGAGKRRFPDHVTSDSPSAGKESSLTPREEAWISKYFAEFLKRFYPQQ